MAKTFTRREIVALGCQAGTGALLLGACGGPVKTVTNRDYLAVAATDREVPVALMRSPRDGLQSLCDVALAAITDGSWLSPGDSVLLKLSCNSGNDHPAVTAPEAVSAMIRWLKERGAGKIFAGDQAGVGHVRLTASHREGSTRELMRGNGLLTAIEEAGAEPVFFEEGGWDDYFHVEPDFESVWSEGVWLPRILERVDHVINLPRLATHALAGYTAAIKLAVGWLRDDSRLALHQNGATFFERTAEISHFEPLRSKIRLNLTLVDRVMANIGPDIGSAHEIDGWLALGSAELVAHDYVVTSLLPWFDGKHTSLFDIYTPYPEHSDYWNEHLVESTWGEEHLSAYSQLVANPLGVPLENDRCLSHLARVQAFRPQQLHLLTGPEPLPEGMGEHLSGLDRSPRLVV